jgi:hypothetical protein
MRAKVRIEYQRWICQGLDGVAKGHREEYPHYLGGLIGNEDKILAAFKRGERYEEQQAGDEPF